MTPKPLPESVRPKLPCPRCGRPMTRGYLECRGRDGPVRIAWSYCHNPRCTKCARVSQINPHVPQCSTWEDVLRGGEALVKNGGK